MKTIKIEPLTRESFTSFGDVIETDGAQHYPINGGMCERYHDLARVGISGPGARQLISIFIGQPYVLPLQLKMVERHPLGSQAFMPLSPQPFLAIVAPDDGGKPGVPRAFMSNGMQGVNYPANAWHGVLTPLGQEQRFVVIDRGGEGNNLEEFEFEEPFLIVE